jgi:hypothetical protein
MDRAQFLVGGFLRQARGAKSKRGKGGQGRRKQSFTHDILTGQSCILFRSASIAV